ncbi:MAG: peptidylprolyl isomerase, partial [Planctomycetes bacterium]|nr:peptidylprolyl isomerase [Planctomycetota bacterium]
EIAVVEEPTAEPETPAAVEAIVEEIDVDAVVVTVNGQEITEKEVSEEVTKLVEMQKKRMPPGMEMPDSLQQQVRTRVVETKIEQTLLSQEIEKNDIAPVTDEEVIEEIKKIAGQRGQSMEDVEKEIAQMGMTLEDLKGQIRSQMEMKDLMESLSPDSVVTEADAKKFYDENPQHFAQKDQVKASHILCGKRGIKEDEYPVELEKIEKAQARLDAGEKFEDVAKECSTCPSSAKGGDLGFFGKGQMDPAFEKAAFELEVGQTSGVVKTSFGYHIIKLTDKKDAEKKSFDEAKEQITQFLTQQKQRGFWTEYSKTMRDGATIEYSEKEQTLRDEMQKAAAARAAQQADPRTIQPAPAPAPAPKPKVTEGE